ncbi:MAG: methyltransferase domain-containing protein [Propionibacteriales bacterium]|nr:methyltransferase domain-containing protein [Propionibacteriales bacterium]
MPDAHPIFAFVFAGVAAMGERTGYARRRAEALTGARGRLLIVGLGPGHDLAHLPAGVSEVVAVEPDPSMRAYSARRVHRTPVPTWLVGAVAEALPLPDACVDAALVALVLCSVPDPAGAAAELRRVLRPGGTLHVLEHVHASQASRLRRWQDRLDPLWSRLAAGCHLNRDTRRTLAAAGFDTAQLRNTTVRLAPAVVAPHLVGTARQRTA